MGIDWTAARYFGISVQVTGRRQLASTRRQAGSTNTTYLRSSSSQYSRIKATYLSSQEDRDTADSLAGSTGPLGMFGPKKSGYMVVVCSLNSEIHPRHLLLTDRCRGAYQLPEHPLLEREGKERKIVMIALVEMLQRGMGVPMIFRRDDHPPPDKTEGETSLGPWALVSHPRTDWHRSAGRAKMNHNGHEISYLTISLGSVVHD